MPQGKRLDRTYSIPNPPEGCAHIKVGRGMYTVIDAEDLEEMSKYTWNAGNNSYVSARSKESKTIYMHRLLCPTDAEVDHKDHDPLNNRKSNLRPCTHSQNQCNKNVRRKNKHKWRGITWVEARKKWKATIRCDKKIIYLGLFSTAEEAGNSYLEAANKYHGEFARANNGA